MKSTVSRTARQTLHTLAATAFVMSIAQVVPLQQARAQAVTASGTELPSNTNPNTPVVSGTAKPVVVTQSDTASGDVVVMSPFEVDATEDKGYLSTTTLAGTRIKTDLRDVGSAITAINSEFLRDTGAKNSQDLLIYTPNTEVGGIGGNFLGAGNGAQINTTASRGNPQQNTRVRGLTAADNTRDYYLTDIAWDSYNTERIDLQRGPNAILFGLGSPAGIVNSTLATASFKDKNSVEFRYGSYDSARGVLDINKVLLKDELAIRAIGLDDAEYFRQDPAYRRDERVFLTARWEPKFLQIKGAHTTIQANYENGKIRADNPDPTPPIDAITQWFALGKPSYDASVAWASDPTFVNDPANAARRPGVLQQALSDGSTSPYYSPWVSNMGRIYDNVTFLYNNPNSGSPGVVVSGTRVDAITGSNKPLMAPGQTIPGLVSSQLVGIVTYDLYATRANLPGANLGQYKARSLTDQSIFNFYDQLLGGPNDNQNQKWEAYNLSLQQTFFNNRLGIEASYDKQNWHQTQEYMFQGFANAITVDINQTLSDGSPNPNFGRPAVASDSGYNSSTDTKRESYRVTGFGELRFSDFMQKDSVLASVLGRHVFTAMYSHESNENTTLQWARYTTDDVYGNLIQTTTGPNRQVATISYLGASLANAASASGANISRISELQQPTSTQNFRSFNSQAGTVAGSYWQTVPITIWNADLGDLNDLYNGGNKSKSVDSAWALVWQGFFWDGTIVPMIGYRKDKADFFDAGAIPAKNDGVSNPNDPTWQLPGSPNHSVDGSTTSYSVVVHTPEFIRKKLPGHSDLSFFYNHSQNFSPQPGRVGIYGQPLDAPQGKTDDYGVTLSTLNDRLVFKINWYKTTATNQTLPGGVPGNFYMIGDSEAWGFLFATQAKNHFGSFAQDYTPGPGQTQAEASAEQQLAVSTFLSNLQSDAFWKAWNIVGNGQQLTPATAESSGAWQSWIQANGNPNLAITGDTESKGTEFELTAQPTKNWTITINASKTHATQMNLAASVSQWIEDRHAFFQGPAGLVREWNNTYSPSENLRNKFDSNTYAAYLLIKLQEGGDVPELRPWRFNLITNYNFDSGFIKGLNIGGGYRWQDKQIVGYAFTPDFSSVDISHPYYSPTVGNFDLWIGYEHKITRKINWRIQLNIQNIFAKKDLIPVTVEPDGSWAQVRIPELTQWTLTNTFTF